MNSEGNRYIFVQINEKNTCQPNKDRTKNVNVYKSVLILNINGVDARASACAPTVGGSTLLLTSLLFFRGVPGFAFLRSFKLAYD